jgi:hypothetical protein
MDGRRTKDQWDRHETTRDDRREGQVEDGPWHCPVGGFKKQKTESKKLTIAGSGKRSSRIVARGPDGGGFAVRYRFLVIMVVVWDIYRGGTGCFRYTLEQRCRLIFFHPYGAQRSLAGEEDTQRGASGECSVVM